jgi:pentatricopeptide repeat protein
VLVQSSNFHSVFYIHIKLTVTHRLIFIFEQYFHLKNSEQLVQAVMNVSAQAGNPNAAITMLLKVKSPTVSLYGFIIIAYGKSGNIDHAVDVFYTMLNDHRVTPNIQMLNTLLNACAESKMSTHDMSDRTTKILHILQNNERCLKLNMQPDLFTYNILLKCLLKSLHQNASAQAEAILDDMEHRSKTDSSIQPNKITFNLALQICLQTNDEIRTDAFMLRMQTSNVRPDARLCNTILNHYAQTGTAESAQRAESFLVEMMEMAKTDASVQPNIYTYNIVLNAWGRSSDPMALHRMWTIYKNMVTDKVELDEVTYMTLITHCSKSEKSIHKADRLLESIESSLDYSNKDVQLDHTYYVTIIKGYILFNDADNATRILLRFIKTFMKGKTRSGPIPSLYYHTARAWIKSGSIERASAAMEKIQGFYDEQSLPEPPDLQTYLMLYNAWKNSTHPDRDEHLVRIKSRLDYQH